ncbi:hypothetical protein BLOT_012917 [Blomia tropicalis]|nr:hypothetical protein BLOT_012917 [Blomia tropicalis]
MKIYNIVMAINDHTIWFRQKCLHSSSSHKVWLKGKKENLTRFDLTLLRTQKRRHILERRMEKKEE